MHLTSYAARFFSFFALIVLSGCAIQSNNVSAPPTGAVLRGSVHGGQQPVAGATIQLYAAGSSGYASASTPLLSSAATTDASGSFTITGAYTCPTANTLVYLTATGGNPGLTPGQNNPQIAEMAALGKCGDLTPSTFIAVSELTTVAAVWPLAPFMTDYQHVGTSSTNAIGLANAFLSAASLANVNVPNAPGVVPSGVTAPVAEVNTLANILAACVNSTGGVAGDATVCGNLMTAATKSGGVSPTDTVGAALGVAQQPGTNVAALYALSTPTAPYQPGLLAAPNDWTVTIQYSDPTMKLVDQFISIAIDSGQNVWVGYGTTSPQGTTGIFEYAQDLSLVSPAGGFTDPTLNGPYALAFDLTGNLWIANTNASNLTEYAANGSFLKSVTGGGLVGPSYVAVDKSNNIWATSFAFIDNTQLSTGVSEFTNAGVALSPTAGYAGGGADSFQNTVALDTTGNAWISAAAGLALLGPGGTPISGSSGYGSAGNSLALDGFGNVWSGVNSTGVVAYHSNGQEFSPSGGFTGGGLQGGLGVAIDGAEHIWLVNIDLFQQPKHVGALSEFDSNGNPLTISTGYATIGTGGSSLAIDSSGNVWWPNGGNLYKCIGVAAPVVTPIAIATKNGQLGARP